MRLIFQDLFQLIYVRFFAKVKDLLLGCFIRRTKIFIVLIVLF